MSKNPETTSYNYSFFWLFFYHKNSQVEGSEFVPLPIHEGQVKFEGSHFFLKGFTPLQYRLHI